MADLIREANREITNKKLAMVETTLHNAIDDFSSPFYAYGSGVVKNTLDAQLAYFRRLGPVTILGDQAAVAQLAPLTGMAFSSTQTQRSDDLLNEYNANGFIGRYNGVDVVVMDNAYFDGTTTPILAADWLYIIPGGVSADQRNLKIVNEGPVHAFESQNIDDLTYEIRLDQYFGCGFVSGKLPTIGAYDIN
jgi:hypothetical protein